MCELVGGREGCRKARLIMAGVIRGLVILGCDGGRIDYTVFGGITLGRGVVWVGSTHGSGAVCLSDGDWVDFETQGVAGGVVSGGGAACN